MNSRVFKSFSEELSSIQKEAALKDALKIIKALPRSASSKAKALSLKAVTHPKFKKVVDYISDPINTADLGNSVATIAGRLS